MNGRLIIAVITSILEQLLLVAAVLWLLPQFGIVWPLWVLFLLMFLMVFNSVVFYIMGSRALRRKLITGLPSMAGATGFAANDIFQRGIVNIKGELWQAEALDGFIPAGVEIVVVSQEGLKLKVSARRNTE